MFPSSNLFGPRCLAQSRCGAMGCGASTGHFAEQSYAKFKADGEEMQGWDRPVVVVVGPVGSIFNHVFFGMGQGGQGMEVHISQLSWCEQKGPRVSIHSDFSLVFDFKMFNQMWSEVYDGLGRSSGSIPHWPKKSCFAGFLPSQAATQCSMWGQRDLAAAEFLPCHFQFLLRCEWEPEGSQRQGCGRFWDVMGSEGVGHPNAVGRDVFW